jgi:hypothetical protein
VFFPPLARRKGWTLAVWPNPSLDRDVLERIEELTGEEMRRKQLNGPSAEFAPVASWTIRSPGSRPQRLLGSIVQGHT